MSQNELVVLYKKSDVDSLYKINNFNLKIILPISPNIYNYLFSQYPKLKIILPIVKSKDKKKILDLTIENSLNLKKNLNKNKQLSFGEVQNLIQWFYIISNSIQHLEYILPDNFIYYILYKNKWKKLLNKSEIMKILVEHMINFKVGPLIIPKTTSFFSNIIRFYNFVILRIIKHKKSIVFTALNYGFPYIMKKIPINNDHKIVVFNKTNQLTFLFVFYNLFKIFLGIYKKRYYVLYNIKDNNINKIDLRETINSSLSGILLNNIFYISIILENLSLEYSRIEKNNFFLLKELKPIKIISHHIRWRDNLVLASNAKKLKIPNILISHGSHTYSNDYYTNYEKVIHQNGMLTSNFTDKIFIQSPLANNIIKNISDKYQISRVNPLMWGYEKAQPIINKKFFTILHASTTKDLSPRPFMYESAFEYIEGLKKLILIINEINNIKLIVRYRPTNDLDINTLRSFINESDKVTIKDHGKFIDDLNISDLLISFSSTTIEESLTMHKPVGIYGGNQDYAHVEGSKQPPTSVKRYPVYNFNDKNLSLMIKNIKKYHFNSPLMNNEINNFVWIKDTITHNKFFEEIFY